MTKFEKVTLETCVHFTGITEEFRASLIPHLDSVYGENSDWSMRCTGCDTPGCHCHREGNELCEPLKCLQKNRRIVALSVKNILVSMQP